MPCRCPPRETRVAVPVGGVPLPPQDDTAGDRVTIEGSPMITRPSRSVPLGVGIAAVIWIMPSWAYKKAAPTRGGSTVVVVAGCLGRWLGALIFSQRFSQIAA